MAYLASNTERSSPSAHNEGVVGADDGNGVNTLCLELVVLLEVRGEMVGVAGRLLACDAVST